jgi:hypothetical protein
LLVSGYDLPQKSVQRKHEKNLKILWVTSTKAQTTFVRKAYCLWENKK